MWKQSYYTERYVLFQSLISKITLFKTDLLTPV